MLKKLLIAAAAVVVGLLIVKKSSLVQVWLKDLTQCCSRQISPETKIVHLHGQTRDDPAALVRH